MYDLHGVKQRSSFSLVIPALLPAKTAQLHGLMEKPSQLLFCLALLSTRHRSRALLGRPRFSRLRRVGPGTALDSAMGDFFRRALWRASTATAGPHGDGPQIDGIWRFMWL
ncbi:uncharacterized protein [Physcomitrium patens]|uniref:uncharacterized protein n=1 Tax=Physcomitrium patens TaxID=3218 RepID=UPI003CCD913A